MNDACSGETALAVYCTIFVLGVIVGALAIFACATRRAVRRTEIKL